MSIGVAEPESVVLIHVDPQRRRPIRQAAWGGGRAADRGGVVHAHRDAGVLRGPRPGGQGGVCGVSPCPPRGCCGSFLPPSKSPTPLLISPEWFVDLGIWVVVGLWQVLARRQKLKDLRQGSISGGSLSKKRHQRQRFVA